MSTQITWRWLGGFFDGEGSIVCVRQNSGNEARTIRLTLTQCGDQAWVLDHVADFFEGHGVSVYRGKSDIQIGELASVKYVLRRLMPYLIVKRSRAEECLSYMKEAERLKQTHGKDWFLYVSFVPPSLRAQKGIV